LVLACDLGILTDQDLGMPGTTSRLAGTSYPATAARPSAVHQTDPVSASMSMGR
jgi:hypothetical protein